MATTRALAKWVADMTYEAMSLVAVDASKRLILDTLGSAIAGWRAPGIPVAFEQMQYWGGREEATVMTCGGALPAPHAAFVNGCMVHAMDFDDVHLGSILHIMSSVLPVSLAMAEVGRRPGCDLVLAVAMGVEYAVRVGEAAQKRHIPRGYLPASVVGGFGATMSACQLMGLSLDETVNALGLYYAQTSGNRQALLDFTLTKRMQPAFSARSAIWAAALAERGVTGPERALEGEAGFFAVYVGAGAPTAEELTAGRECLAIEEVAIKPFPSCGANHRATQTSIELATREDLSPEDILEVDLHVGENDVYFVGAPFEIRNDPQVDAQFSVAYSTALGLVHRRAGLREYAAESVLADHVVAKLARRIRVHELEGTKGKESHEVAPILEVKTRDGRLLSHSVFILKGTPQDPMTFTEVTEKFRGCADFAGVWPLEQAEKVIEGVEKLEDLPDVGEWVRSTLVVPDAGTTRATTQG